jgi:hypothetical protein
MHVDLLIYIHDHDHVHAGWTTFVNGWGGGAHVKIGYGGISHREMS